jgi:hypothetical protein
MNKWVANGISHAFGQELSEAGTRRWRLKALDVFAVFNLTLFAVLASSIYWQRFLQFRSRADLPEFLVYAVAIMAFIVVAWDALRPFRISVHVLVLFEAGLLLHFAGGLLHPGGMRLYDLQIGLNFFDYPMRFDKIVHFVNAFIGCIVTLDALHTQTKTARYLVEEKEADYVFTAKDNQETLKNDIAALTDDDFSPSAH